MKKIIIIVWKWDKMAMKKQIPERYFVQDHHKKSTYFNLDVLNFGDYTLYGAELHSLSPVDRYEKIDSLIECDVSKEEKEFLIMLHSGHHDNFSINDILELKKRPIVQKKNITFCLFRGGGMFIYRKLLHLTHPKFSSSALEIKGSETYLNKAIFESIWFFYKYFRLKQTLYELREAIIVSSFDKIFNGKFEDKVDFIPNNDYNDIDKRIRDSIKELRSSSQDKNLKDKADKVENFINELQKTSNNSPKEMVNRINEFIIDKFPGPIYD
ncbi:hypothetical protein JEZ13_02065 [bacterium]|nr:hypothetical protein [bacterium]